MAQATRSGASSQVDSVEQLQLSHPQWEPWLDVLGRVLREAGDPAWPASVPSLNARDDLAAPLLAGAVIRLDRAVAHRWVRALFAAAAEAGYSTSRIADTSVGSDEAVAVLEAALCQDAVRLDQLAGPFPPQAFRAIAALAAWPLLQACGEEWAVAVPSAWRHGYCPICGAWPALAEARGERDQRLRCGRCGTDWPGEEMRCVFCDNRDHDRIGLLVEDPGVVQRQVEACLKCHGYLKSLATLEASPRARVVLDDLASVDLDLAALSEGFARPSRPGYALGARLACRN